MTQITVPNVATEVEYSVTSSSTGPFTVPFPFFDDDDVQCLVTDALGVETTLVVTTDFTWTTQDAPVGQEGNGYSGGTITLVSAIGDDGATTLKIFRSTVIDRTSNYPSTGPFSVPLLNDEQNKHIMMMQEFSQEMTDAAAVDAAARAVIQADVDANEAASDANHLKTIRAGDANFTELAGAASRAGKYVKFTGAGDVEVAEFSDSSLVLSRAIIAGHLWPQTTAESNAGVTPTDYAYPPGDTRRYDLTPNDLASAGDNHTILQAIINVCIEEQIEMVVTDFYLVDDELNVTVPGADFKISGLGWDTGFEQVTSSKITLRIQGTIGGAYAKSITVQDIRLRGAWERSSWSKGSQPKPGVDEANWVWASPLDIVYAEDVKVFRCEIHDSQYDAVSIPKDITRYEVSGCYLHTCQDDGVNPGGTSTQTGLGALRGHIHNNILKYISSVAIHCSGGPAVGTREDALLVHHNIIDRCRAGIDWSPSLGRRHVIESNYISNTGYPDPADSEYAAYPGPEGSEPYVYYDSGSPANAAFGITSANFASESEDVVIRNNIIRNMFDRQNGTCFGINISNNAGQCERIVIDGNIIDFTNRNVTDYPANDFQAIKVGDSTSAVDNTMDNISVRNNIVYGNNGLDSDTAADWGRGMILALGQNCEVIGNYINRMGTGSSEPALYVAINNGLVANNYIDQPYGAGITLYGPSTVSVVKDNVVTASFDATVTCRHLSFISAAPDDNIVEGNTFIDGDVFINGLDRLTFKNNTLILTGNNVTNTGALLYSPAGDGHIIQDNTFRSHNAGADPATWVGSFMELRGNNHQVIGNTFHQVESSGTGLRGINISASSDDTKICNNDYYGDGYAITATGGENDRMVIANNTINSNSGTLRDIYVNVILSLVAGNTIVRRDANTTAYIQNTSVAGSSAFVNNTMYGSGTISPSAIVSGGADTLTNNTDI